MPFPCAELEMHPAAVAGAAVASGLDAIGVCDHNSVENAAAVARAGRKSGLAVIPGMEITSAEEVHVLGLCPDLQAALELQARVYHCLPGRNDERAFGTQVVANEDEEVLGFNDRLLAGATTLAVDAVVDAIHRVDGLAVASHVDREAFGIFGQLGLIPSALPLDALEVSRGTPLPVARALFAPRGEFPILCASDAHEPKDVGRAAMYMLLQEPTVAELRRAFAGAGGRAVLGGGRPMEDLALHILDIAHNSVDAGATEIEIDIKEDVAGNRLTIELCDNGCGMSPETLSRAADPFFTTHTTRRVGMGLPLFAQAARSAGGEVVLQSQPGQGTRVRAVFEHSHIDRAPLGDIETTLMVLLAGHPEVEIRFRHTVGNSGYEVRSGDLREAGIDMGSPEGLMALRRAIRQGESAVSRI